MSGLISLCLVLLNGQSEQALARPALIDNLDGPNLAFSLQLQHSETKLLEHGQETGRAQFGRQAERVLLQSPINSSAILSYQIPKAPAIGELRMTLWVISNCPGVHIAARVTLPRTYNPATSAPYQVIVRGTSVSQLGLWQQITLDRVPERLARQARIARLQTNDPLDERGAYVQELLLIAPGSNKLIELLVDHLEVEGVLLPVQGKSSIQQVGASAELAGNHVPDSLTSGPRRAGIPNTLNGLNQPGHSVIKIPPPKRPQVPRIIQWQGESFDSLAKLDFDAIAMKRPATLQEMAQARTLGLSLICPPPSPDEIRAGKITDAFSSVMAWDLGSLETILDLNSAKLVKDLLTKYDPNLGRLTVLNPIRYVHEASRVADILLIGRDTLGADLSLSEYATWLSGRKRLARPGTPIWVQIDTELPARASAQQTLLAAVGKQAAVATHRRLATQVALATTLNPQGFYFTSHTSLNTNNLSTRSRALALELTNLRIGLIKPWLTSGKLISTATSNHRQISATVLQVERSYLLVPIQWNPLSAPSFKPRHRSDEQTTFLVPGVPESCAAYFLTPASASAIRHRRVTGGILLKFESPIPDGFVLFTEDGHAYSRVARYIQKQSYRTTRRTRELASIRLQQLLPRAGTLSPPSTHPTHSLIRSTRVLIEQCDALLAQRNVEVAFQHAVAANTILNELEIIHAQSANDLVGIGRVDLHEQSKQHPEPLSPNLSTMVETSTTRLFGANFESVVEMQQSGWRHQRLPTDGLITAVHLSPKEPYQGSYCLEMEVQPAGPTPAVVATAPVWVSSSPVQVQAGDIIEFRGMVRVPEQLTGSVDGLQIFDSLGGMPLALRIQQTGDWKPFRIVRVIPTDTELTLTFALTGLGKAQIDAVTVSKLPSSTRAARQPTGNPFSAR